MLELYDNMQISTRDRGGVLKTQVFLQSIYPTVLTLLCHGIDHPKTVQSKGRL